MKTFTQFLRESSFHQTEQKLVRSGLSLGAATKLVDAVTKHSSINVTNSGNPYQTNVITVMPENNIYGAVGFIIANIKTSDKNFTTLNKYILSILKKEKIEKIETKQVQTGHSYTWKIIK